MFLSRILADKMMMLNGISRTLTTSALSSTSPWNYAAAALRHIAISKPCSDYYVVPEHLNIRIENDLAVILRDGANSFNKLEDALRLFDAMIDLDPYPIPYRFNKLLSGLARMRHHSVVASLFMKMSRLNIPVNEHTLDILMISFCGLGRPDYGFSVLGSSLKRGYAPKETHVALLMNALVGIGRNDEAARLVTTCSSAGKGTFGYVAPDDYMYATLMNLLSKMGKTAEAVHVFNGMQFPSLMEYNTIIHSLCKIGRVDEAMSFFSKMARPSDDDDDSRETVDVYKATRIRLQWSKEDGICPDMVTFNFMIKGCANVGRWEYVTRMLEEMIEPNIDKPLPLVPDTWSRGDLRWVVPDFPGPFKRAMEILEYPEPLDGSTFNILLQAYHREEGGIRCEDLRRMLSKAQKKKLSARMFYIYLGLDELSKKKKDWSVERPDLVAEMMETLNAVADIYETAETMSDVMEILGVSCCNRGNENGILKAKVILELMRKTHLKPNVLTCNILMRDYCSHGQMDGAMELLKFMKTSLGIDPDILTYNILISGYWRCMRIDDMLELFHQEILPQKKGGLIIPDMTTYNVLLTALLQVGRCSEARDIFQEMMIRGGLNTDISTYSLLLTAFCSESQNHHHLHSIDRCIEKSLIWNRRPRLDDDCDEYLIAGLEDTFLLLEYLEVICNSLMFRGNRREDQVYRSRKGYKFCWTDRFFPNKKGVRAATEAT